MNLILHFEDDGSDVKRFAEQSLSQVLNLSPTSKDKLIHIQYKDPSNPTAFRSLDDLCDKAFTVIGKYPTYTKCCMIMDLNRTNSDSLADFSHGFELIEALGTGEGLGLDSSLSRTTMLFAVRSKWIDGIEDVVKLVPSWASLSGRINFIRSPVRMVGHVSEISDAIARDVQAKIPLLIQASPRLVVADKGSDDRWLAALIARWFRECA